MAAVATSIALRGGLRSAFNASSEFSSEDDNPPVICSADPVRHIAGPDVIPSAVASPHV
jgi:hypothetical protein